MRWLVLTLLVVTMAVAACGGKKRPQFSNAGTGAGSNTISTPSTSLVGKIVSVNSSTRFAVLNFPVNKLPALEQRMNVYRQGLKVGEVKITGPQRDDNIVADIIAGEAAVGDQVRDR